jgi:hypothetical protein
MTTTEIPVDNGVNVEALLGVRDALAGTPQIARFQWRSAVSWVNGTHSRCRYVPDAIRGTQPGGNAPDCEVQEDASGQVTRASQGGLVLQ